MQRFTNLIPKQSTQTQLTCATLTTINQTRGLTMNGSITISRTVFTKFQMDLASFGMAITGLCEVQGNLITHGLENVGKVKVTENRSVVCPHKYFKRGAFEFWLHENCQEEGWILNTYLGSQNSTKGCDEGTILNYSVTKYVQQEDKL